MNQPSIEGKTLDEINEETHQFIRANQKKRWKDNQFDRIENTIDRIEDIVKATGFFGIFILILILGQVSNWAII